MPEIKPADIDAATDLLTEMAQFGYITGDKMEAMVAGHLAAHREAAVDDVIAAIEARRVEWINQLRNEGRSDGFIRIEPYLHGIVNALSIARRCTTTTPPEPRELTAELAELRAKLEAAEKERDHANLFTQVVLSSLHWTGDGYEWTGGRYDYRMQPSEAAALTTSEIERLRSEAKEHATERNMLMTALDGLLNDFIKAVPSSEPIDCNKFTRYQPALLAYVTVRDRKRAVQL